MISPRSADMHQLDCRHTHRDVLSVGIARRRGPREACCTRCSTTTARASSRAVVASDGCGASPIRPVRSSTATCLGNLLYDGDLITGCRLGNGASRRPCRGSRMGLPIVVESRKVPARRGLPRALLRAHRIHNNGRPLLVLAPIQRSQARDHLVDGGSFVQRRPHAEHPPRRPIDTVTTYLSDFGVLP